VDNPSDLTTQNHPDREIGPQNTTPAPTRRPRRLIRLTTSEIRRLFNLIGNDDQAIYLGLHWSVWRREHQADARVHHFRRRLRLQMIQI